MQGQVRLRSSLLFHSAVVSTFPLGRQINLQFLQCVLYTMQCVLYYHAVCTVFHAVCTVYEERLQYVLYNEEAARHYCTAYEVSTVYEGLAECSAYWHCGACDNKFSVLLTLWRVDGGGLV